MIYPGINHKPFRILLSEDWFKKNDVINDNLLVLKVYRRTKFRRFLKWLGFNVKMEGLKVKEINNGN